MRGFFQRTLKELNDIKTAIDQVLVVAITNPDGVITYVNDRFCDLYKYPREEVIGKTHALFRSGEHSKEFYRDLWSTIKGGRIFSGEIKNRAKDGSCYWAYLVIVPFLNEYGVPYQFVSFRTDITPVKEAEAEKLKLLEARSKSDSAEAALKARDRFVSMAAHELKTPITSIQLIHELLSRTAKEHQLPPELQKIQGLLDTASFQTKRLTTIINDLMDLSRMEAGRLLLTKEFVDLAVSTRTIIENTAQDCEAAGCAVELHLQPSVIGFWDRARLDQVFINLLSNAMKFGYGKPIEISVSSDGNFATLQVRDHGIGIPEDFQSKIFHRFERADSASRFKGTGLGLWITYQIVNAHCGTIHVRSKPGQGATFTVKLPLADQELPLI